MYPEQRVTLMAKGKTCKPQVYVSTLKLSYVDPARPVDPRQLWETLVAYTEKDEILSIFDDFPRSILDFHPVYSPSQLLGGNRDQQHQYAVGQLERLGYMIVEEIDGNKLWNSLLADISDDESWNRIKEGTPSVESGFTAEEARKIEFLRYLREQGKI